MATWPTRGQYAGAVQRAPQTFRIEPLQQAQFHTDNFGMPSTSSGQYALVFRATMGDQDKAVRVFMAESAAGQDRYRALAEHQRQHPVPSIAEAFWLDAAVEVDQSLYPVVVMEWVEGDSLSKAVKNRLNEPAALGVLADRWQQQLQELRAARFAHGDLQHGNVMVDPEGSFRFIDLDGIWIPEMAADPPSEFGHPNYQHPHRKAGTVWGEHIDWFSALVVYLSLKALAVDPSLSRHLKSESLLFLAEDFGSSDAPIWADLASSPSADIAQLSGLLAACCSSDPLAATDLSTILRDRAAPPEPAIRVDATPNPNATTAAASNGNEWWVTASPASSAGTASPTGASQPASATTNPGVGEWWVDNDSSARSTAASAPPTHSGPVGPKDLPKPPKEQVNADWGAASQSQPSSYSQKPKKVAPPPPRGQSPYSVPGTPTAPQNSAQSSHYPDSPTVGSEPEHASMSSGLSEPLHEWLYGLAVLLIILAVALRSTAAALIPALLGFVVAMVGNRRERRWKEQQQ